MKRTALARRTPLRPKRREPVALIEARAVVAARSGGRCEHPDGCPQTAQVVHHKAGRVGPGAHHPDRLLALCGACHARTHAHPAESYANGTMERRVT